MLSQLSHHLLVNLSVIFAKPTGIGRYALNILPYLTPLQPTLLTAENLDNFQCFTIPNNLSPEQGIRGHLNRLIWTQWQLPPIYQKLQGTLLFSPLPEAPLFSNCRFVVMVHDLIPLRFPRLTSPLTHYFRYALPEILKQATHIICNSQATAREIGEVFSIQENKITPILLGYDASHFQSLDLPNPPKPYFLYLGRPNPYKNVPRIITAFAKLPHCEDYELWLAGSYDHRYTPQLQAQVSNLGLSSQVKFLDYVSYAQLPILLNQALALVFPSLWEGFGLPVLEAMACGTPVITSNLASLPEVVGDAAILVNPYNTAEITAAMLTLVEQPQWRSHLRSLGLQRASQFSWHHTGQMTNELLANLI